MTKEEKRARRAERKAERKAKGKSFREDFKKFIARGNVIDLAVAVVVGGAFGKITTALVSGIIMPCIAFLTGSMDMSEMKIVLQEAVYEGEELITAESAIMYGTLIQATLDFLIIAFTIFLVFRIIKKVGQYTAKKLEEGKELLQNIISKEDECECSESKENAEEVAPATEPEPVKEEPAKQDNDELIKVLGEIRDLLKAKDADIIGEKND